MNEQYSSYREAITYLYGLQKFGIKFGLSKTSNLLEALGNPHVGRKYIHIGGTNGKGSVGAFIATILKEAGLKVGMYSSPHLIRFTERFRINNEEMTPAQATALINELRDVFVRDEPPTFFEATTAMALVYFAREKTDVAIMEVGMGGRLDATNVITPLVSVITNISLEHQFYLGNRLLDIGAAKGGIIKEGIDLVTGATQSQVIDLFRSLCQEKGAPFWRLGKEMRYRRGKGSTLDYFGIARHLQKLELGLKGRFQIRNGALSLAALELLEKKGIKITSEQIREGLKKTIWPGRMQIMGKAPTILLDGSHNPAAVSALAASIKGDFRYRRLILVIGVMEDKEIGKILRAIVPISDYAIYTRPVYSRAASPETLATEAGPLHKEGEVVPRLTEALDRARDLADPEDLIVVCGSLFTVGEAMSYLDPETYKPDGF